MSSAHYQALEPQTSDEDNEDIEQRRPKQQHLHHHYHLRNHSGSTTTACSLATPVMARKGRRRCLLPLVGGVLFFIAFCYLTLSVDTRLALGLGGGSDDSDDEGSHNDLGKRMTKPSPTAELHLEEKSVLGMPWSSEMQFPSEQKVPPENKLASEKELYSEEEFEKEMSLDNDMFLDMFSENDLPSENEFSSEDEFPSALFLEKDSPPENALPLERPQNMPHDELNNTRLSRFKKKRKMFPEIYRNNFRPLNETVHICSESYEDRRLFMQDKPNSEYGQLPVIYFVTPTYPRREQIPELTRLAHTLLHVPRLHWLVADDQQKCNDFVDTLLNRFGIPFTHMVSPMPAKFRYADPAPRGVANRRAALQWLRQHNLTNGVLYFGDDDNTYDLRLFSEIRKTQRVSMFPVGLIADYAISGPVVRKGKVVAFLDSWVAGRRWPVDMAGFAVSLEYMAQYPNVNMPYKPGYEEDLFLRSINVRMDEIEPRGKNCTEILVWHTQTKSKKLGVVRLESKYLDDRSNLGALLRNLKLMGVASITETEVRTAQISKNGKAKPHSMILS
ncbi:galactosylgalactosylxylosylprotein 3-beta-glucuronosyltransferase S isoform X1 [Drosophila serrata]|uniref:galactosylgalactosylxylosylprotein 3-beta-glucuronosyltransferase S isoform X1 n=1 Tax=Drosophila serrata TaxID=7274 RepID=UPI000A1D18E5|nr:galactosylgalactosylxylosylprotein 3-beta-glucuronosyltransferase S isoform X1 [Drosophila serrata]